MYIYRNVGGSDSALVHFGMSRMSIMQKAILILDTVIDQGLWGYYIYLLLLLYTFIIISIIIPVKVVVSRMVVKNALSKS